MSGGYVTFQGSNTKHAFENGRILTSEKVDWIGFFDDQRPRKIDLNLLLTLNLDNEVFCSKFSHSGKLLVIGCYPAPHIYNAITGERIMTLPPQYEHGDGGGRLVNFSPNDKYLAVGSDDGITRVRYLFDQLYLHPQ